jgi:outer membrane protein
MRKVLLPVCCLLCTLTGISQDKWDLRRCVEYALANNISVKQADVQARLEELTLKQSKMAQLPTLNFSGNGGYSSGRNQDPTSFGLITEGYFSNSFNLQSGVDLFNWFSQRNTVAANKYNTQAARANVDKIKNDISLNVAAAYLQALLNREQAGISVVQIQQTQAQLDNTRKLVNAGSVPELNAAELEAQLARDSSTLVTTQQTFAQSLLQLKALLNLDAGAPFEIDAPPVETIPVENLADLQPEPVYNLALANLPQQRVNTLRVQGAQKNVAAARGAMYPTFSMFGSLGTNSTSRAEEITGITYVTPAIGKVTVGGTPYDVFPNNPQPVYTSSKTGYFTQLDQFFRQSIGISVSVPIFNGGALRTNYGRSKLNLENIQLQQQLDNQTLKQDIYRAYTDATAALTKFNANKKSVETAQKVYDFAKKRYDIGLLNTIDLITNNNNLFSAKINLVLAQYDYVFKLKVLEFYKGQGIRLTR